jgi:hypothetical protein
MKVVAITTLFAFTFFFISVSFTPVQAAARGTMSGKSSYASKGYNQAAKEKQMKGTKAMKRPQ